MGQIFRYAEPYLDSLDSGIPGRIGEFVEIGTGRQGDSGSTKVMARWAGRFGKNLYTIDIDPDNCDFARNLKLENVEVVNESGEAWLSKFPYYMTYISVLYLDNFDWDWHPEKPESFVLEQRKRYRQFGLDMTNMNSQRTHLRQAELAVKCLGFRSLVICDDTWYNKWWGHYAGKSGSAVPFLMNHGFEVLYTEEQPVYGTILGRGFGE